MRITITKKQTLFACIFLLLVILPLTGTIMSQVSQPKYNVISFQENIEIREYLPVIAAQVTESGERKKAISSGFRILADYIFGNNKSRTKISMTAPVVQQEKEVIPMTAPVIQQESNESDHWDVRFIMPAEYTINTLPLPNNPHIKIIPMPAKRYVVIRFSGMPKDHTLQKHQEKLAGFIAKEKINITGKPMFAFYNPPWTLPFLRRNEIMFEIE